MKSANSLKIFGYVLLTCLCACSLSFADEQGIVDDSSAITVAEEGITPEIVTLPQPEEGKEYAPVNFQGLSYARMIAQVDEKIHQQFETTQNVALDEDAFIAAAVSKSYRMGYEEDQAIPDQAYPGIFHYWTLCPADWSWLMLEDESVWFIEFLDRAKIANWFKGYALVIRPNNWWDSNKYYRFQLYNTVTQDTVQVNLDRGPLLGGLYTRWITGFLADSYHLQLSDGTMWRVKSIDRKLMTGWVAGDVVYIGVNNDWITGRYDYILINTRMGNWVRASWEQ